MVRVVPYSLILTAAVGTALAVLVNLGQLRFLGNPFLFLALFFLTGVVNGLVAMLLSWRCTNPSGGASFMIWLVPPGFILGGATMAIGFAHLWVTALSQGIPLVHTFAFWRDIGLRGIDFAGMSGAIGQFLFYLLFLAGLVSLRFWHEGRERRKAVKLAWRQLNEVPNEMPAR